jgi:hypothetical protein
MKRSWSDMKICTNPIGPKVPHAKILKKTVLYKGDDAVQNKPVAVKYQSRAGLHRSVSASGMIVVRSGLETPCKICVNTAIQGKGLSLYCQGMNTFFCQAMFNGSQRQGSSIKNVIGREEIHFFTSMEMNIPRQLFPQSGELCAGKFN